MKSEGSDEKWFPVMLEAYDRVDAVFETTTRGYECTIHEEWHSDSIVEPEDVLLRERKRSLHLLARHGDTIYRLEKVASGAVSVRVRARSEKAALDTIRFLKDAMPPIEPAKDAVKFEFVRLSSPGMLDRQARSLVVPEFHAIQENYAPSTRTALQRLMGKRLHDGLSGRIVLWHGPPGTGKTFMLRALAKEWKQNVRVVYVIDPENFFSSTMDYIMSVALDDYDKESDAPPPWTLIVLEDTGEFFSAEHSTRLEQGVARLLNLSDGVLGQGLRCLFLLTTNEPLYHIHPALTRPGRCLANIHFAPLEAPQVKRWFARRGIRNAPRGQRVLAELYAIAEDQGPIERARGAAAGFEVQ